MHLKRQLASNFGLLLFSATLLHSPLGAETWEGATNSINDPTNWNPAALPGAAGTANFVTGFAAVPSTNLAPAGPFSVGTIDFNAGNTTTYSITANGVPNTVTINTGVVNNSGQLQSLLSLNGSSIIFAPGASTDSNLSTYVTNYNILDNSIIEFQGGSLGRGRVTLVGSLSNLLINGTGTTVQLGSLDAAITGPDINLGDNNTLQIGNANTTTIARNIIDNGSTNPSNFTKEGPGTTVTLSGTNNSYYGDTNITGGTLVAGASGALSPNSNFTIANLQVLELATGTVNTIKNLSGAGIVNFTGGDLTINVDTGSTFSGRIIGTTGANGLTKTGNQTLILSGTTTDYTGPTTIDGGTLEAAGSGALSPNSNFTITTPGILQLDSGTTNTIGTITGNGTIQFNNGILTVKETANTTFQGQITGTAGSGGDGLNIIGGATLTLDSSNLNNYSGLTKISGANTVLKANGVNAFSQSSDVNIILGGDLDLNGFDNAIASLGGDSTASVILGNGNLSLNGSTSNSYSGTITGNGGLNLNGGATLSLNNNGGNTYNGQTNINNNSTLEALQNNSFSPNSQVNLNGAGTTLALNGFNNAIGPLTNNGSVTLGAGTLTVNETVGTNFSGTITGGSGGLTLQGGNTLTLNNSGSNYSGLTHIINGTLEANAGSALSPNSAVQVDASGNLRISSGTNSIKELSGSGSVQINNSTTLDILQTANTTFSGSFGGDGTLALNTSSTATLHVTGNSPTFTNGNISIGGGIFNLNGTIGSNGQNLNSVVQNGGTITGTGTLYGDLTITSGGTISPGNSIGTFNVGRNYTQNSGSTYLVELDSTTSDLINVGGSAQLNGGDVIATPLAALSVSQRYTIVHSTGPLNGTFSSLTINGIISNPYLNPQLSYDSNNAYIVIQTSLVDAARTFNEIQVANQLDSINNASPFLSDALSKMILLSEQELQQVFNEMSGEQYTLSSISSQIINHQFIRRLYDPVRSIVTRLPCSECCEEYNGLSLWIEGGAGAAELKNGDSVKGFKMRGYEVTAGAQKTFDNSITLGIAGSYANDQVDFNLNGNQKINSYLGGLYALYRPDGFYLMADIAYGKSQTKLTRTIDISDLHLDARSKPSFSDATAYGELGVDMNFCSILIQPFIAFEVDQFFHSRTHENGAEDFNLTISKWDRALVYSNLGFHITQNFCSFSWGFDVAYLYRLSPVSTQTRNHFATFGADFPIRGVEFGRNGFEGTFNIAKTINNDFRIYAEVTGQVWNRLGSVTGVAGIQYSW